MATLGSRLKKARERVGLTEKQVGEHLGVTETAVSQWELDKRRPNPDTLAKLTVLYNTTSDYLLGLAFDPAAKRIDEAVSDDVELKQFWELLKQEAEMRVFIRDLASLDGATARKIIRAVMILATKNGV
jgi:transcriptional regulator with XRE-family HTH domain